MSYTSWEFAGIIRKGWVIMTLILSGVLIACLLLAFMAALKGRSHRVTSSGGALSGNPAQGLIKASFMLKKDPDPATIDPETQAVLKLYPIFRNIPYSPVIEGKWPMSPDAIDKTLKKTIEERIPTPGPIQNSSVRLLNLLKDPESNPSEITSIVSTSPVFSAKILQSVNSAFFSLGRKMTSVGRAITLLGYNNVRSLVLQDAMQGMIPRGPFTTSARYYRIWVHSAIVSACAGYLGKKIFGLSEYDLATMGLLHDIGKYFFTNLDYVPASHQDLPAIVLEEESYGVNHAVLGSIAARNWQLSDPIADAVAYHHHPTFLPPESIPEEYARYSFILCLSDLVGKLLDYSEETKDILPIRDEYFDTWGIKKDLTQLITPVLIKEAHKARFVVESYVNVKPV